ncbi:hypothetical protein [Martelella mediterranea]|uniref:hypothetical protein n=1 Tax=Martelella mediterranea TaxID=293089 RepID=UPI001048FB94|nr:hypothetical protein [Martelella mediterranea]
MASPADGSRPIIGVWTALIWVADFGFSRGEYNGVAIIRLELLGGIELHLKEHFIFAITRA